MMFNFHKRIKLLVFRYVTWVWYVQQKHVGLYNKRPAGGVQLKHAADFIHIPTSLWEGGWRGWVVWVGV